jgi:hypothetical protein
LSTTRRTRRGRNMITHYAIDNKNIVPVYRIKEGWIPAIDYRENKNDNYYMVGDRAMYCIAVSEDDIYDNLQEAIKNCEKNRK